jgi:hypothetical protein
MPGSFLVVVGGDFTKIDRHRYSRSPVCRAGRLRVKTLLSPLHTRFQRAYRQNWGKLKYKRRIGREQVFRASRSWERSEINRK